VGKGEGPGREADHRNTLGGEGREASGGSSFAPVESRFAKRAKAEIREDIGQKRDLCKKGEGTHY